MKKILSVLLIIITICCFSGCNQPSQGNNADTNIKYIHSEYFDVEIVEDLGGDSYIIRDLHTDVLYLLVGGYNANVMSPIYNRDGSVKLYGGT